MVKKNNLTFRASNRGRKALRREDIAIKSANRKPIISNRRKRKLLKQKERGN